MYIHPDECVDCGACKTTCRVGAIYWEEDTFRTSSDTTSPTMRLFSARSCRAATHRSARRAVRIQWSASVSTHL